MAPLLKPPQIELIQKTVRDYVQEQSAGVRAQALPILEAQSSGVAAIPFELATLLQLLSWERLAAAGDALLSDEQLDLLFESMLSSETASEIGRRLTVALGWYGAAENERADPMIVRQLVWKALILELDPTDHAKPWSIGGYELAKPENWGKRLSAIQEEFASILEWKTRDLQGGRSRNSARIATRILAPLQPELAFRKPAEELRYGTGLWVNFAHGVAMAERLFPGSSQRLDYRQLVEIPLNLIHMATDSERQLIIEMRLAPTIQWAIANNILPMKALADYSVTEIETASKALDEHQFKLAAAIEVLLRKAPDRLEIGLAKFNEVLGYNARVLEQLIMRPTTLGKELEYSLRNPDPSARAGRFYLLDLFVAGPMKEGVDKFEPHLKYDEDFWADTYASDIEQLKDIDINEMYRKAFADYRRDVETAYAFIIEMLLSGLPFQDRLAVEFGRLDFYLLRRETGIPMELETERQRALCQGRQGFILVCRYNGNTFAYEVFPLSGIVQRRTDLHPLPPDGMPKLVSNQMHRGGIDLAVDWTAYETLAQPRLNITSRVVTVHIGHALPTVVHPAPSVSPLSSTRLSRIGVLIARRNLFFNERALFDQNKHQTGSEFVSNTYPPILRLLEVIVPGLGCFNALQTDERPVLACTIDIGLVLAKPVFSFFRGFVKLILKASVPSVTRSLPALGTLTKKLLVSSANSYRSGLNPFEGLLFRAGPVVGGVGFMIKLAYKLNESVGNTLGKPGEFAYINGLESAANPHKWRPIALGDRLAMIHDVHCVAVRDIPGANNRVRSYLINTASGNPYGPALEELPSDKARQNRKKTESVA
ncbi:hypothetical protein AFK24_08465 [Pseudomonas syringae]|uniref:Uncharacterized protein n=1 Tax=Pseudomonas syringae TaxID=317 RepID=A0A1C7Z928_PSESX|nr:hypothetical protein AFK24_08465 [Pseudomonas syringae]